MYKYIKITVIGVCHGRKIFPPVKNYFFLFLRYFFLYVEVFLTLIGNIKAEQNTCRYEHLIEVTITF